MSGKNNGLGFDTLAVRAGYTPESEHHSVATPIYMTNAYSFESVDYAKQLFELKVGGNIYSRLSNPTVDVLEKRVAALDGGVAAVAMSSCHGAMFTTFINLAEAGDEIVSSICIYGGAINMMGVTLGKLGIKTKFVDPADLYQWEESVTDWTKAFFVEVVGTPNANVADIEAIAAIAHRHGIPMIVDSTFTTPALCRPIEFGADIVIHSATKFLCGNGTAMCGIAVDAGTFKFEGNPRFPQYNDPDPSYHGSVFAKDFGAAAFATRLRALILRDIGTCMSPFNAFLCLNGIETLSLRMRKHSENALAIAKYLEGHPDIEFVNYPALESSPYHALANKYLANGAGGVMTFGLKGSRETGARFIDSLKLLMNVANVGDTR
ncbi:MAG: O-acetylhomoserine aminocarboxypropyltransferase/cysteine synthase, partial [Clostridia bacterium]|nr:O-acetylhomoserine aminocarboxypropyltransferase/cysteine synthase [Clostridia bacterium]